MLTVNKVKFKNFRNLSEEVVTLVPKINCIYGDNGNGKTNLLEGIYLSINKKSFRKKAGFQQILSVECEKPEILSSITIRSNKNTDYYSIAWENNNFSCFKNNQEKVKSPEISCIFISPFDSFSFHNESSTRRNLIDTLISRFDPSYKKALSEYSKLLKQKNFILKGFKVDHNLLDAIDKVLALKIFEIINGRKLFTEDINPYLESIYHDIFSESILLKIIISSVFTNKTISEIYEILLKNRKIDIDSRVSKLGPHKDDIQVNFNGFNSIEFCSLGQQKTAYLSLLFAYIKLFGYKFSEFPIVLIDDVSGELDSLRLDLLIKYLFNTNYQVVLTTANEDLKNKLDEFGNVNLINVKDGYFH